MESLFDLEIQAEKRITNRHFLDRDTETTDFSGSTGNFLFSSKFQMEVRYNVAIGHISGISILWLFILVPAACAGALMIMGLRA